MKLLSIAVFFLLFVLALQNFAFAQSKAPAQPDLKSAVTSKPWTWKLSGGHSVGIVTFKPDGKATYRPRAQHVEWVMTWSITGENDVRLVHESGKATILHFNTDRTKYTGADFDGRVLEGTHTLP